MMSVTIIPIIPIILTFIILNVVTLSVVKLSVAKLSVIMLSVVMLSVVAPETDRLQLDLSFSALQAKKYVLKMVQVVGKAPRHSA